MNTRLMQETGRKSNEFSFKKEEIMNSQSIPDKVMHSPGQKMEGFL